MCSIKEKTQKRAAERSYNPPPVKPKTIKVSVGYGWQKFDGDDSERLGKDVLYDTFWKSLRALFKPSCDNFQKSKNVSVSLSRLRASHGRLVWPTIERKIAESDLLIFDIVDAPRKDLSGTISDIRNVLRHLNLNVLLEVGYALGCGKRVLLMCPKHLFRQVPSDLKGFLWTLYTGIIQDGTLTRTLVDERGTMNAFRGMLREVANEEADVDGDD